MDHRLLLDRYLDGLATPGEMETLTRLLAERPDLADALAAATRTEALLEAHFREDSVQAAVGAVLQGVDTPRWPTPRILPMSARMRAPARHIGWAAALLFAVAGGALAWWLARAPVPPAIVARAGQAAGAEGAWLAEGSRVEVAGDSAAVIPMPDGSRAELAPASAAVLHPSGGGRVIELERGLGTFHAGTGKELLRIDTSVGSVHGNGADFSVELRPDDEEGDDSMSGRGATLLIVAVLAGQVEVEVGGQRQVLALGQSQTFAGEKPGAKKPPGDKPAFGKPAFGGTVVAVSSDGKTLTLEGPPVKKKGEPVRRDFKLGEKTQVVYPGLPGDMHKPTAGYQAFVWLEEGSNDGAARVQFTLKQVILTGRVAAVSGDGTTLTVELPGKNKGEGLVPTEIKLLPETKRVYKDVEGNKPAAGSWAQVWLRHGSKDTAGAVVFTATKPEGKPKAPQPAGKVKKPAPTGEEKKPDGNRKPAQEKKPAEGEKPLKVKKPEGEKPDGVKKPGAVKKPAEGNKPEDGQKPLKVKKPDGEKPDEGKKPGTEKKPAEKKPDGEKPNDVKKPGAEKKPGDGKKPAEGEKPLKVKKPDGVKKPAGEKKPAEGEKPQKVKKSDGEKPNDAKKPGAEKKPEEGKKPVKEKKPADGSARFQKGKAPEKEVIDLTTRPAPSRDAKPLAGAIDAEIDRLLAEREVQPSPPADDAEFLRRAFLDLTGRVPTYRQAVAFLGDTSADKRSRLIDSLLASRAFGEHFGTVWRHLLAPPDYTFSTKGLQRDTFSPWLADQINAGRGWDAIVRDLLTAAGPVKDTPQAAFLMANADNFQPRPERIAGSVASRFWGVQLRCAECHDHPFAHWKKADFWGTAAFFDRLRFTGFKGGVVPSLVEGAAPEPEKRKGKGEPAEKQPAAVVKARFLGGAEPALPETGAIRPTFAAWATSAENPFFARATSNRLWAHFFGRGLAQPLDDMEGGRLSHPALLQRLSRELVDAGFDLKHLARAICTSRAYQRTSRPLPGNETDRVAFSHMALKPLSPEALYDALVVTTSIDKTEAYQRRPGKGKGQSNAEPDWPTRDEFARVFRVAGQGDEAAPTAGIPQVLRLLNGPMLNGPSPLVERLVAEELPVAEALDRLYLSVLTRKPTAEEVEQLSAYVARRKEVREGYRGVLWVLLNSGEMAVNH
jgi:ferric-dicitrate binding protein FerR (iron transport regulator)